MTDLTQPKVQAPPKLIISGLTLLFICGLIAIHFFVEYEKNRDLILWQDKLNHLVQLEKKTIDNRLHSIVTGLNQVADNPTVKLYLSNRNTNQPGPSLPRNNQRYLRELLIVKAYELGFSNSDTTPYDFNRNLPHSNGLLLVDSQGNTLVSGHSGFTLPSTISQAIEEGQYTQPLHIEEFADPGNPQLRLGFVLPIYPPQQNASDPQAHPQAYLVAVKDISSSFKHLLSNYLAATTYENINILHQRGNQVLYLLSVGQTFLDIKRRFNLDTPELDAAAALLNPERFQKKIDHNGQPVLLASSTLHQVPWVIMHTIDKKHALSESRAHARFLYTVITILFFLFSCMLGLFWYHGVNQRQQQTQGHLESKMTELEHQKHLLQLIIDNLNAFVILLDQNRQLTYANKMLIDIAGQTAITGLNLSNILGNGPAKRLEHVLRSKQHKDHLISLDDDEEQILQTRYVPLVESGIEYTMIVATDVSASLETEKKKEKIMHQAVDIFIKALERHDPYSVLHSERIKTVALLLGKELGLSADELFNLGLSASLLNIGKFYIPTEILLKKEKLTEEEHKTVRTHIEHTVRMLQEIGMDKHIIKTVSQSFERLDGSGYPNQLKADSIGPFPRILAVANSFVAMTHPRPWRQKIDQIPTLDMLMKTPGYDKKVVIALYNIVENKGQILI